MSFNLVYETFWLLLVLTVTMSASFSTAANDAKPGCPTHCGNLTVRYPFGIGPSCSHSPSFSLVCDDSSHPPKAFTEKLNSPSNRYRIINISDSRIHVSSNIIAYDCPPLKNETRVSIGSSKNVEFSPPLDSPFILSNKANMFFSAGSCDYSSTFTIPGEKLGNLTCPRSCFGFNMTSSDKFEPGRCSVTNGCCEISTSSRSLEKGFTVNIEYSSVLKRLHTSCGYVVFGKQLSFGLRNLSDYSDPTFISRTRDNVPMVVDYVVGSQKCSEALQNPSTYACSQRYTKCVDVETGGYGCACRDGYEGNPYLPPGCIDKNECVEGSNPCSSTAKCINTEGGFKCSCRIGYRHDGHDQSSPCSLYFIPLILGPSLGFLFLVVIGSGTHILIRKRKLSIIRKKFFRENGGLVLKEKLSSGSRGIGSFNTFKLFTIEELKKATNNFSKDLIIGVGGYGTVYKGTLRDESLVAIKKSKLVDNTQIEQFINEMVILTQIHHRNVVKLFGCCLEAEIPILVYEFVPNGSLLEHIHKKSNWLTWDNRLRIATEIAIALGYLHSAISTQIIHRDIKPANILLDKNYVAKISDFGASRLIPFDKTQISTLVQGTLAYVDPEYLLSGQLTDKSDVYSFGVMLAELLTGENPLSFHRRMGSRNLAMYFAKSFTEGHLLDIIDPQIVNEAPEAQLMFVAEIIQECLSMKGVHRPMMKDVALQLAGLLGQTISPDGRIKEDSDVYSIPDFSFSIEAR